MLHSSKKTDGYSVAIKILPYQNCERYICHADGYGINTGALLSRISKIESILLSKPSPTKYRVWFNLDKNKLGHPAMQKKQKAFYAFDHIFIKLPLLACIREKVD